MGLKQNSLVKAEILFSRKCNLKCGHCKMANGKENTLSVHEWKNGMDELKKLGCSFAAFYGAEPLLEFYKLLVVVSYAESIGIATTVITNGTIVGTKEKLQALYNNGGRSLSMSYDPAPIDESSGIKSEKAIDLLTWFKNRGNNVRDVAAIATLTNKNFQNLPLMIRLMSSLGIWTFYDLYHYDRGQIGSKTAYRDRYLTFKSLMLSGLYSVLKKVNDMKKDGYLVHTNSHYLDVLFKNKKQIYSWNCADYDCFPSWVTVDCDGSVYPCDDFQPTEGKQFQIGNIYDQWEEFSEKMKFLVKSTCPGCAWNTHIGAHAIKTGIEKMEDYVHGK